MFAQVEDNMLQERLIENGYHSLGRIAGKGSESGTLATNQDECLHDSPMVMITSVSFYHNFDFKGDPSLLIPLPLIKEGEEYIFRVALPL
jgi:hypothetical protein